MRAYGFLVICLTVALPPPAAGQDARPSHRVGAAVAFDAARGRLVLFGGADVSRDEALNDTWEWDGTRWHQRIASPAPPARMNGGMVFDAARGRVVLYGGFTPDGPLGDLWEWDGTRWTERAGEMGPGLRAFHGMTYDSRRQRVVLVGGMTEGGTPGDDMWEWDGASWSLRQDATEFAGRPPLEETRRRAYRAVLRSDLRNLVVAQESYFADNFTYAPTFEALSAVFTPSSGVTLEYHGGSNTGWSATARHEGAADALCAVFIGDSDPPLDEPMMEGEVVCVGF